MRPERNNIGAPEFPGRLRWLNADRKPQMMELSVAGPVLVHFFDFAQLNSVRALPYVREWVSRYSHAGLTTLGIHSPRFPFTARREALGPALERLELTHQVADDSGYQVWNDYGCKGWPSLFLWGVPGALRWYHFGEGEYAATEEAIQTELRELEPLVQLPVPLDPLRPSDAPGAMVAPPSEELFPGGDAKTPWRPQTPGDALEIEFSAAGAHASVDGAGSIRTTLDGETREIAVAGPGLVDLADLGRHGKHRLRVEPDPALAIYSVSFSAGPP